MQIVNSKLTPATNRGIRPAGVQAAGRFDRVKAWWPTGFREKPKTLLQWFSVLSLVCISASCAATSFLLSQFLTQHMLHRDGAVMLEFVQTLVDIENTKARASGREPDIRNGNMQELLDHLVGVPNMMRTNIYAPDQTLVWSSEKKLMGQRFDDNDELKGALSGKMEIETGKFGKEGQVKNEHNFLGDTQAQFVETYLPLRDKQTGRVIGVAELYRVPHALFQTIHFGQKLIWTTGILFGLCLYLVLFWIVRRADIMIRRQQSRLIEAETLAAVGEMGSAVAHGIRNPLASIRTSAELCIDAQASPQGRESATDIIAQVDRLEKWVRDLLNFAQPQAGVSGQVQLATVIHRVCGHFSRDFEKLGIVSTVNLPVSMPCVAGDEAPMEQVFTNLLANAIEAMPGGGRLTIDVSQASTGATVVVIVRDTGIGIPNAHKARLFTAFQTSKPSGMGLGLSLVRRIVQRFGGTVRIKSVVGAGTQVELTFASGAAL
jgi:signal transduction histidine kinase